MPADIVCICGLHSANEVRENIGRLSWKRTEWRDACDLCPWLKAGEIQRMNDADCFDHYPED